MWCGLQHFTSIAVRNIVSTTSISTESANPINLEYHFKNFLREGWSLQRAIGNPKGMFSLSVHELGLGNKGRLDDYFAP
jgi:hypothetical protein